ncbi:MAG TPA: amidohydrolase [Anaerolineaceae bacterium]|nr:amidohydrolase [Anaerolineaceae bacterium]
MDTISYLDEALELFEFTRSVRRDLHRHPELAFNEIRTSGIVARELNGLGMEVTSGIGKTGVVGLLEGGKPGPVVMLRFDMDALPVTEQTGAEYASENPGIMHACGHDGHVSIGLTVARILTNHKDDLPGIVKFAFQPAEECAGGAEAMIKDGVLHHPRPERILGLHVWNEKPLGWIGVVPGPFMAGSEIFTVRILGKGGHAALPETTVDPVLAAAQVVTALQSIVSRNISSLQTAVVSVTRLKAGDAFNVIPPSAEIEGTIRCFEPAIRQAVLQRFGEIVSGVSSAMGCRAEIDLREMTPAVINDEDTALRLQGVARRVLPDHQLETQYRTMGSEDFSFFMQDVPGCFFFLGSANAGRGLTASHHHPRFDFDEAVLPQAAAMMAASAVQLLEEK